MEYTTLLNKIQANLDAIQSIRSSSPPKEVKDSIENILNKIGLEVQRQGGN